MYAQDRFVQKRFKLYKVLLTPYLKGKPKILDIGCYTADILRILSHPVNYYGIDADKQALEIAKNRGAKTIRLDIDNEEIPLKEKFDIIIATEILEHLRDPEKLLLQIRHLLKTEGIVLLSLPNECTIYHRLKVLLGKGIDGTAFAPHYHLHFPTIKQSNEFISKHFKIIEKQYWIHTGVGAKLDKFLTKIPDRIWLSLANLWPSLFARGVIYLCRK